MLLFVWKLYLCNVINVHVVLLLRFVMPMSKV